MSLFNKNIDEPVKITLKSDPGDPKVAWTIKPCTQDMLDEAKVMAGPIPYAGRYLTIQLADAVNEAYKARAKELEDKPETIVTAAEADRIQLRVEAEFKAGLNDDELTSIEEARLWAQRQKICLLSLVIQEIDGKPLDEGQLQSLLESVRPHSLRVEVIRELESIAYELANLTSEGKAEFVLQYGRTTTD